MHLSDSEESDGEPAPKIKKVLALQKKDNVASDSNEEQDPTDLKSVHDNLLKMKEIAEKLADTSSSKASKGSQKENVNVADLLAMGEPESSTTKKKSSKSKSQKKREALSEESDSDNWEDVEGKRIKLKCVSYVEFLKKFEYEEE